VGGLAGINFEDSPGGSLKPLEEQASLIRSIRAAVPELVVNARLDVFIRGVGDIDEAVARGNAYLAAGADCVYPIACPADSIAELAERIDGPVNILVTPEGPHPSELEGLGVARITWGSGLAGVAYAAAVNVATAALVPIGG
jgi:2-methylisocitrate lyase-like PEP mutase family enzyme